MGVAKYVLFVGPNRETNLSLEYGFDSNSSNEVEPNDVKSLQHQQQPVEQPPGPVRPNDLPAVEHNCMNNPATRTGDEDGLRGATTSLLKSLQMRHGMFFSIPEREDNKPSEEEDQAEGHKQAVTQPLVLCIVGEFGSL